MNIQTIRMAALVLAAGLSGAAVFVPNVAFAVAVSGQGTWETTLQGRDLDGNLATFEAYYDTSLNITWLANTIGGLGSSYDTAGSYPADGRMNWFNANAWADSLTLGGYTNWRLPTVSPIDGTTADDVNFSNIGTEDQGYNVSAPGTFYAGSTASEMAHMYYNTLGDKAYCSPATSSVSSCVVQPGPGLINTGPFSNFPSFAVYWSATKAPGVSSLSAWQFDLRNGSQSAPTYADQLYAWAVHPGDVGVAAVPEPETFAMLLAGLGLVGWAARRRAIPKLKLSCKPAAVWPTFILRQEL